MREELISVRATEVDEAIASGVSGESGVDEEYERIMVMKFDKDRSIRPDISRRKSVNKKRITGPAMDHDKEESSDPESPSWEMVDKDDLEECEDSQLKRQLSVSSSSKNKGSNLTVVQTRGSSDVAQCPIQDLHLCPDGSLWLSQHPHVKVRAGLKKTKILSYICYRAAFLVKSENLAGEVTDFNHPIFQVIVFDAILVLCKGLC